MIRWLFAVLAGVGLLASCEPNGSGPTVQWLIGVSQANLSEPWRLSVTSDIRDEAAGHSAVKVLVTDAADSPDKQSEDIDRLLGFGIDLLIVSPADAETLRPVIDRVYRKIPVVVIDRAIEGYDYSLYLGPDNRRIGREAGSWVAGLIPQGGKVLEVLGRKDSPPTLDRSRGFHEVLKNVPHITWAPAVTAEWLQDRAEDSVGPILDRNPDLAVIFAQNDAMAYGAWLAAKKRHMTHVQIVGIDGLRGVNGGQDLVRRSVLSATFVYSTGGREAVDYGLQLLEKVEGIPKKIILRSSIVTRSQPAVSDGLARRPLDSSRRPVLGFVQVGSESAWRQANTRSIEEAALRAGVDLRFRDGQQSQRVQIQEIRELIHEGIDVLALSPIVETGWDVVLAEVRKAGIPVILTDRKIRTNDPGLWLTFVGSDFVEEGRRAGVWLRTQYPEGARIVEIGGTTDSTPAVDRHQGFLESLEGRSGFRWAASLRGEFTRDSGKLAMQDFLRSPHPSFDVVFAHNDDMALGAISALEAAGLNPGTQVQVVSVDASKEAFEAMIRGKLACSVECTPLLGPQLMKITQDYLHGKALPYQFISSEEVFLPNRAKALMASRRY